jgi:DNA (cytosine-5)-methyltransferase 1
MDGWTQRQSGLVVPEQPKRRLRAADLFCGAGGFSCGLHEAGIDVVAALDSDPHCAASYLWNLGSHRGCAVGYGTRSDRKALKRVLGSRRRDVLFMPSTGDVGWVGARNHTKLGCRCFHLGDARSVRGADILDILEAMDGTRDLDIAVGGPPCQGMSRANSRSGPTDPRNNLVLEFIRLAGELGVSSFLFENVPPLLIDRKYAGLRDSIISAAHEAGFVSVVGNVIDAAHYGVAQHRRRSIVCGSRRGVPALRLPFPTHWCLVANAGMEVVDMLSRGGEDEAGDDGEPAVAAANAEQLSLWGDGEL